MIHINEDFSISNDRNGWSVCHTYDTQNAKTKEATRKTVAKHFATLEQSCNYVMDNSLKDCEGVADVLDKIVRTKAEILCAIHQSTNVAPNLDES